MTAAARFPLGAVVTLAELEGEPYRRLAGLREREPVSWLPALGGWLVTRRDLAHAVMRDAASFTVDDPRFTTAQVVGPSMLSLDGEAHARHRAPFVAPFRLAEVRDRLAAGARETAGRLVAELEPAGRAELRAQFAGPLATAVVSGALGLEGAGTATVLGWYEAIVGAVNELSAGRPAPPAAAAAVAALGEAVREAAASGEGTLAAVAAAGGARLDGAELASNVAVVLFGGIETVEGTIASAAAHLLSEPEILGRVRADPSLLPAAAEESLRLEPAAAVVDRYATRPVVLGGAEVAAGDLVRVSITAANRDPATFPDPGAFVLGRENVRRHLTFASGPHVCVGMHLARLEAHVALGALLDGLPGLRLAAAGRPPVRGLVFRKPPAVEVVWDAPARFVR